MIKFYHLKYNDKNYKSDQPLKSMIMIMIMILGIIWISSLSSSITAHNK